MGGTRHAEDLMTGPAAYSPYELLRVLIERVGWPTEQEKHTAVASVAAMERMQIFGNLASMMQCPHDPEAVHRISGVCGDCGSQVTGATGQRSIPGPVQRHPASNY